MIKKDLTEALSLLAEQLAQNGQPETHLVVCGGSALIITGMVQRIATKDIDVLGFLMKNKDGKRTIVPSKPLPDWLSNSAQQVAGILGLEPGWLNAGPADLNKWGLPDGLTQRLEPMKFGNSLTVHFLSRLDQIQLKVYASADSGPGRHFDDLNALNPTAKELELGAKWALTQDPSESFHGMVKKMLEVMGFEEVAGNI